jgi:hypothetical protein
VKKLLRIILRLKPIFKEEKMEEEEMVIFHLEEEQEPEIIEEIHTWVAGRMCSNQRLNQKLV